MAAGLCAFHGLESQDMAGKINVVLCCDKAYAPYAGVASHALCRHTRHDLKLMWLVPQDDVEAIEPVLRHLQSLGMRPMVIPVDGASFAQWSQVQHISLTSYLRLLIPDLVPEDRVIYLDCDTLVLQDLAELFSMDMQGHALAGAEDVSGGQGIDIPMPDGEKYINSGVLLMDLAKLRQQCFLAACQQIYVVHASKLRWMDQCIINVYANEHGGKLLLEQRWNCQVQANQTRRQDWQDRFERVAPGIVHYIGAAKPWQAWCNPAVAGLWQLYASESGVPGVQPHALERIDHAMELAQVHDMNGDYQQASQLKDVIIHSLHAQSSSN